MRLHKLAVVISLAVASLLAASCAPPSADTAQEDPPNTTNPTATTTAVPATPAPTTTQPTTTETPAPTLSPDLIADPNQLQGPAPPIGYRAVLPSHNRLDADRINLVFDMQPGVPGDPEMFDPLLSWDGLARLQSDRVVFGLFAIEPFRSNQHLFNLWMADSTAIERDEFDSIPDGTFPDMVSIRMRPTSGRASAQLSQFTPYHGVTPDDDIQFREILDYRKGHIGSLTLYANATNFASEGPTLAHELGHALFGVADEYYGDSGETNPEFVSQGEWPNCANSKEQAEQWWGDLDGTYDPMIDTWIEESGRLGIEFSTAEVEAFRRDGTVDLDDGFRGCYDVEGFYRPARAGLMTISPDPPAFGPVNRRWAERILASYTGEIPAN